MPKKSHAPRRIDSDRPRLTLASCQDSWGTWLSRLLLSTLLAANGASATGLRTVVIGDSLSAEYEALPDIPGIEDPTAYAAVSVPGWESRCWVEVLGLLRPDTMDFGARRTTLPGWGDLRFTGYKYNFAIPGFQASQYEDIVNSSLLSNPQHLLFKRTLGDVLRNEADACVVWIGANEFRAQYGFLYEGGDPASLIRDLRHDIGEILDFIRDESTTIRTVVVTLPDLGAAPTKQAAHPDPVKRERVSQATRLANQAISELAAARGMALADPFALTRRLIEGGRISFGPVDILPGSSPDNDPRYAFTREGLHPNTALQVEIARLVVATLNTSFGTAILPITDGEALSLLGMNPQQPYLDWAAAHVLAPSGMGDDPDLDGLVNFVEFLFDLDPGIPSASPVVITALPAGVEASYRPDPSRSRLASVTLQSSADLATWTDVPAGNLTAATDGRVVVRFPATDAMGFLRLRIGIQPIR